MTRLQRWLSRFDPGFLVVLVISLVALWPFISRASLPQETDAELHIFRLQELSYLVRGGELYPRWAPNFYHGYGYPIFNYYAPLTYYLGLLMELMPRLGPVEGVKAVFILGVLAAALGMYGFVRDNWGRSAGYVAAAVYVYAPYVQFIDPHARGVLAESFSLGVFPLTLWALDRLRRNPHLWSWVVAVLAVAAVILSHNLMALLFFGLLLAWAGWQVASYKLQVARSHSGTAKGNLSLVTCCLPLVALFFGLGLAAFFWLPVILERNAVTLTSVIGRGDNYDFHTHFLSWRELLAFSRRLDWGASEPAFHFNLGVAQWLLGGLGVALLLVRRVTEKAQATFFAVALAVLLFLMLPASTFVWETVPFLPFFQFPWRLLGAADAMLAVLAGVGVSALEQGSRAIEPATSLRSVQALNLPKEAQGSEGEYVHPVTSSPRHRFTRAWITAALVSLPILLGLPLSQPAPWPDFGPVNMLRMTEIEWKGRWLGTTSTADFVPSTVDTVPGRIGSVVQGFYEGKPLDRVNRVTLPEGASVEVEVVRPLLTRYRVYTPENTRLRLYQFDFPGWFARIDGQVVKTELGRPEGFIVIPVPAGEHVVEVEFGSTPARTLAMAISLLALVAMLLTAWWMAGGRWQVAHKKLSPATCHSLLATLDWTVLAPVLVITAIHLLVLQPLGWLHLHSTGYTAEPAKVNASADFGGQIALLGYSSSAMQARSGDTIDVTLYWKAQRPLEINYQVFLHVLRADGTLVTQSHKLNPGEFPTRRWPLDKYVWDRHQLALPADMPPGEYTIATGMWVQTEGWRLPLWDSAGQQIGDNYILFTLKVGK
ncbi:MAG TPA: hypothetical protein VF177_14080 [Anaerolineae bacterium]